MAMSCSAFVLVAGSRALPPALWSQLDEPGAMHVFTQIGAEGAAGTRLSFREEGTSRRREHVLPPRAAAVWSGSALAGLASVRPPRVARDTAMLCSVRRQRHRYSDERRVRVVDT